MAFSELLLLHSAQNRCHLRHSESSSFRTNWERHSVEKNGMLKKGVFPGIIYLYISIASTNEQNPQSQNWMDIMVNSAFRVERYQAVFDGVGDY